MQPIVIPASAVSLVPGPGAAAGAVPTARAVATVPVAEQPWLEQPDTDSYGGQDAEYVRFFDANQCKEICIQKGYGGFVVHKGWAYFRRHSRDDLLAGRKAYRGSTMYIRPPPAPVTVVPRPSEPAPAAAAAAVAKAAAAAPVAAVSPEPPAYVEDKVPEAPLLFPALQGMDTAELQYLQANPLAVDDFILEQPAAKGYRDRINEMHSRSATQAQRLLSLESALAEAAQQEEAAASTLALRRAAVDALLAQQQDICSSQTPQRLAAELKARANASDQDAEYALQDALDGGDMDAGALSQFKQNFLRQKMEKHWRIAVSHRAEQGS
eukprot:TRINITY_DN32985_c0_g2_i1.p1 TRINITY_DN32985_c0_g2~~TRINITY_DN32985_c0_g2_i1.p1  ORF type:complete len:325 (-),score=83.89 TRINITY_DN32985_c0_g2_i1:212-1186(-)